MQLTDLFGGALRGQRNEVGLEFDAGPAGSTRLTFGELDEAADRMAHVFAGRGLAQGDRLCLYLPNGIDFVVAFLACVRMGVIVVPVNVLYREREVAHVVADARPRAALTSADRADVFAGAVPVWDAETLRSEGSRLASSPVRIPPLSPAASRRAGCFARCSCEACR